MLTNLTLKSTRVYGVMSMIWRQANAAVTTAAAIVLS